MNLPLVKIGFRAALVLVIAGVGGPNPATVQIDFDLFAFSSGGPIGASPATSTIPEPSILALFGLGLLGISFTLRKKTG